MCYSSHEAGVTASDIEDRLVFLIICLSAGKISNLHSMNMYFYSHSCIAREGDGF